MDEYEEYYSDEEDDIRYLGSGDESEEVFEDGEKLKFEVNGKTLYPYFAYTLSWDWDIEGKYAEGERFCADIDEDSIEITDDYGETVDYEPTAEQLAEWEDYLEANAEKAVAFSGGVNGWESVKSIVA